MKIGFWLFEILYFHNISPSILEIPLHWSTKQCEKYFLARMVKILTLIPTGKDFNFDTNWPTNPQGNL